jgi:hypothetical protein
MCINIIHHQKNHYKTWLVTLILKYICNFSYFVMYLFQQKYTSYVHVNNFLLEFFKK